MDGMDPALLVPVFPAKDGDRYPGVHEYGVHQPVEVNFQRYFDLQEHDEGYHGLDEAQDCPELPGNQYIIIENHCEAGIEHIDVGHDQVERGEQEEVVLQELHDAIQDDDTVTLDAFLEEDRDIALGAVELALGPPFSLAAGGHESQRLFIVNDGIMDPAGTDAVGQAFHGEFHILRQAVAAPAVFLHDVRGDAHARAAEAGRKAQVVLAQMPQMVDGPEGNGKGTGYPCVRRVLGGQVSLEYFLSLQESVVHDCQEIQVHQVVGVEDAESVVALIEGENFRRRRGPGPGLPYGRYSYPL